MNQQPMGGPGMGGPGGGGPGGMGGAPAAAAPEPKVGDYLSKAIDVWKDDIGTWIVVGIIGYFALGVGMWGGFQYCAMKARRGEKVEATDVLYPFQRFADFFIPVVIIYVGLMLCVIPGILLATWWYFAWPMMCENPNLGWKDATAQSKEMVGRIGLVPVLIVAIVGGIIGGILYFITAPFNGLIQSNAYYHIYHNQL